MVSVYKRRRRKLRRNANRRPYCHNHLLVKLKRLAVRDSLATIRTAKTSYLHRICLKCNPWTRTTAFSTFSAHVS